MIILNHSHVCGGRARFCGETAHSVPWQVSGTALRALIRRRTRSLLVFHGLQAGTSSVAAACHMGSESLFPTHAYACHHLVQTCKDRPAPHDRTSPHDVPCSMELVLAGLHVLLCVSGKRRQPYTWLNQRGRDKESSITPLTD